MTRLQEILQSKTRPELISLAQLLDFNLVTLYRWRNGSAFPRNRSAKKLVEHFEELDFDGIFEDQAS